MQGLPWPPVPERSWPRVAVAGWGCPLLPATRVLSACFCFTQGGNEAIKCTRTVFRPSARGYRVMTLSGG